MTGYRGVLKAKVTRGPMRHEDEMLGILSDAETPGSSTAHKCGSTLIPDRGFHLAPVVLQSFAAPIHILLVIRNSHCIMRCASWCAAGVTFPTPSRSLVGGGMSGLGLVFRPAAVEVKRSSFSVGRLT